MRWTAGNIPQQHKVFSRHNDGLLPFLQRLYNMVYFTMGPEKDFSLLLHSNTQNLASPAYEHLSRFGLIGRNGEPSLTG